MPHGIPGVLNQEVFGDHGQSTSLTIHQTDFVCHSQNRPLQTHKGCDFLKELIKMLQVQEDTLLFSWFVSFLKGNFLYWMLSPSACTVTTWLCVDTFHSVVFHLCKYRRSDSRRKLFRENLPFSWVLNQQFHFRLNYHNFFDYFIMLLSMFKHFREEYVVQYQCQARLCESFNDIEINSRLQQGFFIS